MFCIACFVIVHSSMMDACTEFASKFQQIALHLSLQNIILYYWSIGTSYHLASRSSGGS